MQNGHLALLDVLGFSDLAAASAGESRLQDYLEVVESELGEDTSDEPVEYVTFSDSIVLTTRDDSTEALQALVRRTSSLFGRMLSMNFPVRGAISSGSFFRSVRGSGTFVAGRAVIDAYRFETAQDWVGVMLAPSALISVPDIATKCAIPPDGAMHASTRLELASRVPWAAYVQPCSEIPFHNNGPASGTAFDGFAIVPTFGVDSFDALSKSIAENVESLARLKMFAPSPEAQAKYTRTIAWLRGIERLWLQVAHWAKTTPVAPE